MRRPSSCCTRPSISTPAMPRPTCCWATSTWPLSSMPKHVSATSAVSTLTPRAHVGSRRHATAFALPNGASTLWRTPCRTTPSTLAPILTVPTTNICRLSPPTTAHLSSLAAVPATPTPSVACPKRKISTSLTTTPWSSSSVQRSVCLSPSTATATKAPRPSRTTAASLSSPAAAATTSPRAATYT